MKPLPATMICVRVVEWSHRRARERVLSGPCESYGFAVCAEFETGVGAVRHELSDSQNRPPFGACELRERAAACDARRPWREGFTRESAGRLLRS